MDSFEASGVSFKLQGNIFPYSTSQARQYNKEEILEAKDLLIRNSYRALCEILQLRSRNKPKHLSEVICKKKGSYKFRSMPSELHVFWPASLRDSSTGVFL